MERENSIMNQPKIIAYMKPSCGWSNGVRAVLKKYNLAYEDRDIINNPEYYQEMVTKSGQPLQPTLDIDGKIVADVSGDEECCGKRVQELTDGHDGPPSQGLR